MFRPSIERQEQLKKKEWKDYALKYGQKEAEEKVSALLSLNNPDPSKEAKKALRNAEKLFLIWGHGDDDLLGVTSAPEDEQKQVEVLGALWLRYQKERGQRATIVAQLAAEDLTELEAIFYLKEAFGSGLFLAFTHIGGGVLDGQIFKMMSSKEFKRGFSDT